MRPSTRGAAFALSAAALGIGALVLFGQQPPPTPLSAGPTYTVEGSHLYAVAGCLGAPGCVADVNAVVGGVMVRLQVRGTADGGLELMDGGGSYGLVLDGGAGELTSP